MEKSIWIIILIFGIGCRSTQSLPIELNNLADVDIDVAGEILINREMGFHKMEYASSLDSSFAIIFVHGYGSLGKEWVQPILDLTCKSVPFFWYRWEWNQCPESGANQLLDSLISFANQTDYDSLWVIGHSYGGLISAILSEKWEEELKLTIHVIAAPMAGMSRTKKLCDFTKETYSPTPNTKLIQWKTVHEMDNAFNKYENDPQDVKIENGEMYQLDREWNGKRLGHNRSISFISNKLCEE